MANKENTCLCDECSHCIGYSDPEWGCECDLCSDRFGLSLKQIFKDYFEDYVKEEMKNGLSRQEAEAVVKKNHESFNLIYCPDKEDQITYDEYIDGYYDYKESLADQERECC